MAIRYTIGLDKADSKKLQAAFERLQKLGRSPRPVLGRIGLYVRREAQRRLRTRRRDWGPPTGRLRNSLAMRLGDNFVVVGSNLVYAAIQQLGGVVKPKTGRYLAIPATTQLRRRGVWPRDLPRGSMKFVRVTDIQIGTHRWRGPALVRAAEASPARPGSRQRATRGPIGEVMFALVRQVKIRGRPYLVWDSAAQQFAIQQFRRAYDKAWRP